MNSFLPHQNNPHMCSPTMWSPLDPSSSAVGQVQKPAHLFRHQSTDSASKLDAASTEEEQHLFSASLTVNAPIQDTVGIDSSNSDTEIQEISGGEKPFYPSTDAVLSERGISLDAYEECEHNIVTAEDWHHHLLCQPYTFQIHDHYATPEAAHLAEIMKRLGFKPSPQQFFLQRDQQDSSCGYVAVEIARQLWHHCLVILTRT